MRREFSATRSRAGLAAGAALVCALWPCTRAWSQALPTDGGVQPGLDDLARWHLPGAALDAVEVTTTGQPMRVAQAPGVLTVITADDIAACGCTSLADLLRTVPGFYDVFDLVTHDVGMRGLTGGARASGSVLKLMIDGQAVDFRPSTGNFFGEELVPLEAIEQIEIIRGPGSARYGADAWLGVVNVVTRSGRELPGVRVTGAGALVRANPGGGGAVTVGLSADHAEVLAAASMFWFDRSGLGLPGSSPVLQRAGSTELAARTSQGDVARPQSLFVKAGVDLFRGRLTFSTSVQHLDAAGEFQDFGPLSHGTRVDLYNEHFRLKYEVSPTDRLSLEASAQAVLGFSAADERLDVGRLDVDLVRHVGVAGYGAAVVGRYQFRERSSLTVGLDLTSEDQLLQSFDQHQLLPVTDASGVVLREVGTITPGEGHGAHQTFWNGGAFVQGLWGITDAWTAVAGARLDVNSVYGATPSVRAGVVYAPAAVPLSLKLLYGSSFKAPSATLLYTQPMTPLDVRGNPGLVAETAHTLELSLSRAFAGVGEFALNGFALAALQRIEQVQRGATLEPENRGTQLVVGAEAEGRLRLSSSTRVRLALGLARSVAAQVPGQPVDPLYPWLQLHASVDQALPVGGLHAMLEASLVGPRASSAANALMAGQAYELPAYVFAAATLSLPSTELIGQRATRGAFRVSNLFGSFRADPGYAGIDVPAQGVTAVLLVTQQL